MIRRKKEILKFYYRNYLIMNGFLVIGLIGKYTQKVKRKQTKQNKQKLYTRIT